MNINYALKNKTKNLIAIINPQFAGNAGIEAALLYRINKCVEIDSSALVKDAFSLFYDEPIPQCSDTIFNAFIPFLDFCRSKLILNGCTIPKDKIDQYKSIYKNLDMIFFNYQRLRNMFDRFFDLMYSFSNFMPVPANFNGGLNRYGKGTFHLNKDYPYEYLKNLKDENSGIYKRDEMYDWLSNVLDTYHIKEMYDLKPPYPISEYYGYSDEKLHVLMLYIEEASNLIEKRFD
ncbi:hypothetical protein MKA27_17275 [[Clostridium] innocuum]|uniref:hypothetical protein n=1 Tax=Clostridium innocuum TaxID=1522 RepID=UPI000D6C939E|nr:hypothetical protein [[Clostridium] innocuum]MCR0317373.1 hypothetical protein [[Clostridium] innocuum]MCR0375563.1 hypothetical protein [[Clostridium] innocuum]MCR0603733.1 hypothetical protein [[Clostridium] innocuum]PWJ11979.1 hypothetical protein ATF84_1156 [[Clostridium] innocuum]SSA47534.1 hypothetical protein SAMN04487929_1156 [[Clostridium] innocuum]